ncbi:MAG: PaaI family thioesterase [Arcicella sp.]|nr:PaaI family thioesterase [Arcicella sp.]
MSNPVLEYLKSNIGKSALEAGTLSPYGRWLNGTLVAVEEGELTVEVIVRKDMCNPGGILHGGVATGMMDDVIGMTVFSMGTQVFYSTVNLSVDFLFGAKPDEKLIVKAKIIRMGKKIAHAEGEIRNEAGQIVAKCTTNLVATSNVVKA